MRFNRIFTATLLAAILVPADAQESDELRIYILAHAAVHACEKVDQELLTEAQIATERTLEQFGNITDLRERARLADRVALAEIVRLAESNASSAEKFSTNARSAAEGAAFYEELAIEDANAAMELANELKLSDESRIRRQAMTAVLCAYTMEDRVANIRLLAENAEELAASVRQTNELLQRLAEK